MNKKKLFSTLYLFLIYAFLYIPLILLIIYSFNQSKFSLFWKGFSLKWYLSLFHNSFLLKSALNSLILATTSATLTTLLSLIGSLGLKYSPKANKNFWLAIINLALVSPDIIIGVSLLIIFTLLQLKLGFFTILLSHLTLCLPFGVITFLSTLEHFDFNLLEVAQDLGASEINVLRYIFLPLLWPAILSAWILSFTLSLDDVVISFFTTGPQFEILPLRIYSMVRVGIKPEVNALCTLLIILTFIFVGLAHFLLERNIKGGKRT
ncbi:MAG: spermidine/putrescine transport system permease protein [Desulfonauticus sp.]|nr:spermidine/putrescine transport system permease protein [Desulfonauticus sp.]